MTSMTIRRFLGKDVSFGPDDLKVMGEAFPQALAELRLYDRDDAMVEMVARRIVRAALSGERDPVKLREIALQAPSPATNSTGR
jgi:hypothetical protein